ncbi:MAG: hypothetical protein L3J67_04855 [Hyphomicrobiaceae bacterium]|nr:hypothetical protein [Hyphomicrobiaceae bacterium]
MEPSIMGLAPDVAQGLSVLLFVLAALMLLLVSYAVMKRRRQGQKGLPGAGVALLMIGVASFVGALILKIL